MEVALTCKKSGVSKTSKIHFTAGAQSAAETAALNSAVLGASYAVNVLFESATHQFAKPNFTTSF